MKTKLIFALLISFMMSEKLNSQVTLEWAARYNSQSNGSDYVRDMAIDTMGNVYILGSDADEPPGPLVLKYNSSGQLLWSKKFTNSSPPFYSGGKKILVDSQGNVYAGGVINGSNYLIIKYNTDGVLHWYKIHSGTGSGRDELEDVRLDENGNISVIVTGYLKNLSTNWDVGTVKYDTSGNTVWVGNYNPNQSDDEGAKAIDKSSSSNIQITGFIGYRDFLTLSYDSKGNLRWAQTWNGPGNNWDQAEGIASDKNGNVYVTGSATMDSTNDRDIATIKYDSNGNQKWIRFYDGSGQYFQSEGKFIKTDPFGNVVVAGYQAVYDYDYCTIKYDSLGNQLWVQGYNGEANREDFLEGLAVDKYGDVYVTGITQDIINRYKISTIKYDKDGNQQWIQKYPDYDTISGAKQILIDKNLNVYIAGTISFNPTDIIVLKYSQSSVGVEPITENLPEGYKLYQNYPNPFNARTNFRFRLPARTPHAGEDFGFVTLKVYDVFGREVATLVNEKKEPGEHQVEWNADGLSSGVYYYRMISGRYIETKKALLIK